MCLDNLKSLSQTTIIIQKRGVYMYTLLCRLQEQIQVLLVKDDFPHSTRKKTINTKLCQIITLFQDVTKFKFVNSYHLLLS